MSDLPGQEQEIRAEKESGMLPFFVEFVKFTAGFAAIIAVALVTLHIASAAL